MFCFLYRWMISWALDSRKKIPGPVTRHMGNCTACAEFARTAASLNSRLSHEAPGFFQGKPHTFPLQEKIISALETTPVIELLPPKRRYTFMPAPALAAALVVVIVVLGVIFRFIPISPLSPPVPRLESIKTLSESVLVKNPLTVTAKVESPIETEMNQLKADIHSAAEFLVSCLDVKISQYPPGS